MGKNKYTSQRGWGLIETLLTIGAIAVMSLAVYAVFKPADATAQVRIEQDNLRDISRNVNRSLGLLGSFEGLSTAKVDQDGLAPSRMKRAGDQLQTYWGTPIAIQPYQNPTKGVSLNTAFSVVYPQTPSEVCAGLASAMGRDAFDILVNGESVYDVDGMNPSMAAQRCADGNATMEFVFHSGLVSGQAVAAPPLILPPAPPSVSRPPSTPPVMAIPENPDVDDATPGTLPAPPASSTSPPPVPPPLTPPPPAPTPEPITITTPPPVPITPPGAMCTPPATWTESQGRTTVTCPAGTYGTQDEQRSRPVSYTCPEAWDNPVEERGAWSDWSVVANNCTACPTLAPQVEYRWQTSTGRCPSGQLGTVSHEYEQSRSRTRTHVCPAGTLTLPSITYGDWSSWVNTGNTRNPVNTCEDICVVPSPNPETEREEGTASRTQACPSGQIGEIKQERPRYRTRTRTWSCPNPTGSPSATSWSTWSGWTQYGSWTTISNTCAVACVVPSPNPEVQRQDGTATRIVDCSAGQFGQINQSRPQHRTRTRTWSCPSPTGSPTNSGWSSYGSWTQTGSWTETSRTCASCGTPTPQTRVVWQNRSSPCPAGQTGSNTWQEQRNQSQSGTYNCPAGTRTRPAPTWSGTWVNGSWTGNKRNENNTCTSAMTGQCSQFDRPMGWGCGSVRLQGGSWVHVPGSVTIDGGTNGGVLGNGMEGTRCVLGYTDSLTSQGYPSPLSAADQNRLIYDHVDMAPDWFDQSFLNQSDGSYSGRIGYGRVYARSATAPARGQMCLNTKFEFMNN